MSERILVLKYVLSKSQHRAVDDMSVNFRFVMGMSQTIEDYYMLFFAVYGWNTNATEHI